MRRADRLFQIVQHLRGGRLTTARQLSERLEVSERTIYRDIADLTGAGVPIDGEAGIGYLMREGFDLPPMMFSKDEIVALVAGARLIRAWGGTEMARAAQEALVKIESVLPPSARDHSRQVQIHAFAPPQINADYRRRLDEEQQSFQKLLDQVRAEHATRYLQNTRLPLSSIAYMVGFSDASNFRRAYTKWTGKSPREVRHG